MSFSRVDDFDTNGKSFRSVCPVTGLPRQPTEAFVVRGPEIVFYDGRGDVSLGFFDVRPAAIVEAARDLLGMVDAAELEALQTAFAELQAELEVAGKTVKSLREQAKAMTLGNAELIVQNEGLVAELEAAYAELYDSEEETV